MAYEGPPTADKVWRAKIATFADLGSDWDGEGGQPIGPRTRALAHSLAGNLPNVKDEGDEWEGPGTFWSVVPCGDGSILFESDLAMIEVWVDEAAEAKPNVCEVPDGDQLV